MNSRFRTLGWIGLAGLSLLLLSRLVPLSSWASTLEILVADAGPVVGPIFFITAFTIGAVLLLPQMAMVLTCGYLFGPSLGTLVVTLSTFFSVIAPFLLARTVLRKNVERQIANDPRWSAIDRAITQRGGVVVLLLRLNPILPMNLSNYAFGLTGVKLVPYLLASSIGMWPMSFAGVILGSAAKTGVTGHWSFWTVAVLLALVSVTLLARMAGKALAEIAPDNNPPEPLGCPSVPSIQ
jgi:uncharacterized membrane protein YdjX (TVP38/TMEM64 family)